MIKSYMLYDSENNVTQFTRCDETEIDLYQSNYIEIEEDNFVFDLNYDYTINNGEIVSTKKNNPEYLLLNVNKEYEDAVRNLTIDTPDSEKQTWVKQENEARAYKSDNTALTPLIDVMCEARNCTKEYMVNKIIEKADAYAVAIGRLTGLRQAKEKEILGR